MSLFFYLKEDKLLVSLRPTTQGQHSIIVKSELPFPGCRWEEGRAERWRGCPGNQKNKRNYKNGFFYKLKHFKGLKPYVDNVK